MGLIQYECGKNWENEIMDYYHKKGWWVFKIPTEFRGTICDIIVIKNSSCLLIEAKHTKNSKLYYKSSGIYKKKDELNHFVSKYNTNIYIMIKSDTDGIYWTTWLNSKELFEKQGYLDLKKDCIKAFKNENNS